MICQKSGYSAVLQPLVLTEGAKKVLPDIIRRHLTLLSVNLNRKGGSSLMEVLENHLSNVCPTVCEALRLSAKLHNTSPESIRSSINGALKDAWDNGNAQIQYSYFMHSVSFRRSRPGSASFIASIELKISHELEAFMKAELEHPKVDDGIPPEMKRREYPENPI